MGHKKKSLAVSACGGLNNGAYVYSCSNSLHLWRYGEGNVADLIECIDLEMGRDSCVIHVEPI